MPTETVLDHDIHYEQAGDDGPPGVMIHGVPTNSAQWQPVQERLAPYLRTYAIDLIGMGKSDKPLDGWDYTFENDARILEALMDEWDHDEMIVVGDDWGGGIALTFGAQYPDRTDVCIAQSPVAYDQWPVAEIEAIARWDDLEGLVGDKIFELQIQQFPMLQAMTLRRMVYRDATVTGRDMRAFREPYETVDYGAGGSLLNDDAGYGDLNVESVRALARRAAPLDPDWMIDLRYDAITSPTMILWGREDQFMDPVARYRRKQDITSAPVRAQLVEEAGHLGVLDRPAVVADAILDFVTEYRGTDALAEPYTGFPEMRE